MPRICSHTPFKIFFSFSVSPSSFVLTSRTRHPFMFCVDNSRFLFFRNILKKILRLFFYNPLTLVCVPFHSLPWGKVSFLYIPFPLVSTRWRMSMWQNCRLWTSWRSLHPYYSLDALNKQIPQHEGEVRPLFVLPRPAHPNNIPPLSATVFCLLST